MFVDYFLEMIDEQSEKTVTSPLFPIFQN